MSKKEDHVLAVFIVENEKTARDFLKKLNKIDEADKNAEIVDAAIADHTKRGRIKVKQTKDIGAMKGGFGGGAMGVMVGAMLFGPVGAAIGGVSGGTLSGLYARFRDKGIEDKFMRQTAAELEKGKSALFVQYVGDWSASRGAIDDAVKAAKAELLFSTLAAEHVEEIQQEVEAAAEELGGEEVVSDYEVETVPEEAPAVVEAAPAEAAATEDDLTKIKGVGPKTAAVLTGAGVITYDQLASTSEPDLRRIFSEAHTAVPQNVGTWAMQAAFAQNGDWPGLNKYNEKSKAVVTAVQAETPPPPPAEPDDLTQLEGIGPKVAKALAAAGYDTYEKLANANEPQLRKAMHQADMTSPTSLPTWPMQAAYATHGDWQGLHKYNQKRSHGKTAATTTKTAAAETPAPTAVPDDLTQLSGIGTRMASILAAGGVTTYNQLEHMDAEQLRVIVSAGGALPSSSLATWPTQASYAAKGDWQGLAAYNKRQHQ